MPLIQHYSSQSSVCKSFLIHIRNSKDKSFEKKKKSVLMFLFIYIYIFFFYEVKKKIMICYLFIYEMVNLLYFSKYCLFNLSEKNFKFTNLDTKQLTLTEYCYPHFYTYSYNSKKKEIYNFFKILLYFIFLKIRKGDMKKKNV